MIPENKLSQKPLPSNLLVPLRQNLLEDYEWGGIALNDSSQGLKIVIWKCFYNENSNTICLKRVDSEEIHEILQIPNVTSIGLAFDQNMKPQICYVTNNSSRYYWYDSYITGYATLELETSKNICVSLDDNRPSQVLISDIILAYQRNNKLYFRQQRDRYQTEYILDSENITSQLWQIGMNFGNRFQFMFK